MLAKRPLKGSYTGWAERRRLREVAPHPQKPLHPLLPQARAGQRRNQGLTLELQPRTPDPSSANPPSGPGTAMSQRVHSLWGVILPPQPPPALLPGQRDNPSRRPQGAEGQLATAARSFAAPGGADASALCSLRCQPSAAPGRSPGLSLLISSCFTGSPGTAGDLSSAPWDSPGLSPHNPLTPPRPLDGRRAEELAAHE